MDSPVSTGAIARVLDNLFGEIHQALRAYEAGVEGYVIDVASVRTLNNPALLELIEKQARPLFISAVLNFHFSPLLCLEYFSMTL